MRKTAYIHSSFALATALLLLPTARSAAGSALDLKIEKLYDGMSEKYDRGPGTAHSLTKLSPDFTMPSPELFKFALKSYCVLMQSPDGHKVTRPDHYSFLDYTLPSNQRRLYIYDVKKQEFIQNMWSAHGAGSNFTINLTLNHINFEPGANRGIPGLGVLQINDGLRPAFFGDVAGSAQSEIGMAVVGDTFFWSPLFKSKALGLYGPATSRTESFKAAKSSLVSREIIIHADIFDSPATGTTPILNSTGCVMLPRSGYLGEVHDSNLYIDVMKEISGAPLLLYHNRLLPDQNEKAHNDQLKRTIQMMDVDLPKRMAMLAQKFGWSEPQKADYLDQLRNKVRDQFFPKIEDTHAYFENASDYFRADPADTDACLQSLGIE